MTERCGFTWADGWGAHECSAPPRHGGRHGCRCDAVADRTPDDDDDGRDVTDDAAAT